MEVVRVLGRMLGASNQTFLAEDAHGTRWVYKPAAGERRLWDFPDGPLGRREVAAHALARHLRIATIPETVWGDGPLGEGSLQRFVDGRPTDLVDVVAPEAVTERWLPVATGLDAHGDPVALVHADDPALREVVLLDVLLNNSDRKGGHLLDTDDGLVAIDHGVSLHVDPKLRTVLWGFAGEPLTDAELDVARRAAALVGPLSDGLHDDEWAAVVARAEALVADGVFPAPSPGWPPIPWPPF